MLHPMDPMLRKRTSWADSLAVISKQLTHFNLSLESSNFLVTPQKWQRLSFEPLLLFHSCTKRVPSPAGVGVDVAQRPHHLFDLHPDHQTGYGLPGADLVNQLRHGVGQWLQATAHNVVCCDWTAWTRAASSRTTHCREGRSYEPLCQTNAGVTLETPGKTRTQCKKSVKFLKILQTRLIETANTTRKPVFLGFDLYRLVTSDFVSSAANHQNSLRRVFPSKKVSRTRKQYKTIQNKWHVSVSTFACQLPWILCRLTSLLKLF